MFNWDSAIPALGASGAISGVMGAYAVLFPKHQILTFFFIFLIPVPAILILGYWFVLQFVAGVNGLGMGTAGGGGLWGAVWGVFFGGGGCLGGGEKKKGGLIQRRGARATL